MFAYQDEAVDWMGIREDDRITPGGFLCHEMGLGKTHIVCKHIAGTIDRAPRSLILTTKSTLNSWKETLCRYSDFTFDVKVNAHGIGLDPVRPIVVVSTHASVLKRVGWYIDQGFDRLLIDEAHVMRNGGRMFINMIQIAKSARYRWGITATPFNNKDADMIPYVQFLRASDLPLPGSIFKHYFLRKRRDDVLTDAPKLIFNKMVYDFDSPMERLLYDYVAERIDETEEWINRNRAVLPWRVRGQMMLTLILRKRQAAIHPQLVLNAEKVWARQMGEEYNCVWNPDMVTKINKIAELVGADQKAGKNTLIVTHFAEEMKLIKDRLDKDGVRIRMLNGKTSPKKRAELEKKDMTSRAEAELVKSVLPLPDDVIGNIMSFLDTTPEVVILQIQAGGVGISLPWVHHVINAAPDWNPFLEQQSIYRAYRVTTKHDVTVTSMYFRDTIELDMQKRQADKMTAGAEWLGDPIESVSEYIRMPII